jgi:transposase-like protein
MHNWMQKADLQPTAGGNQDLIAVDKTVIKLNDQRFWLYAAVDPETNEFLHLRLFSTRTTVLTKQFLCELAEKQAVVDGAPWFQATLFELEFRFHHSTHGNRNAVERVFKELKRRTSQFANHFCLATAPTAETLLQTFVWNQLI